MAIFAAVVRAGSFSATARALRLTKSAVSKQVTELEAQLRTRLLARSTRRLRLTEPGEAFYRSCAQMLDTAKEAQGVLSQESAEPVGTLRITAPVGLGELFVGQMVADFMKQHPTLRTELILEDSLVDLAGAGFDLAVRGGALPDSSLMSRTLAPLPMVISGSRRYLDEQGRPSTPAELRRHAWIAYSPMGDPQRVVLTHRGRREVLRLKSAAVCNNGGVLRTYLLAGLGLGMLPRFCIERELRSGALEAVLPEHELPRTTVCLVYSGGAYPPAKVRLFVDFTLARQDRYRELLAGGG